MRLDAVQIGRYRELPNFVFDREGLVSSEQINKPLKTSVRYLLKHPGVVLILNYKTCVRQTGITEISPI